MLVYRVCNELEARYQREGEPWQSTPFHIQNDKGRHKGAQLLYVSLYSEYWRRKFNSLRTFVGKETSPPGHDHTLLLEIPDDSEELRTHPYCGMEWLVKPEHAIVCGVAGPAWPPPAWCPQPEHEYEWNVLAEDYENPSILQWQPRDGRHIPLERQLNPDKKEQKDELGRSILKIVKFNAYHNDGRPVALAHEYGTEDASYTSQDIIARLGEKRPARSFLEQYRPSLDWYATPEFASSGHGINHTARVLIWAELLVQFMRLDPWKGPIFDEPIRWAAVTHDTQRLEGGKDLQHGVRAGAWAEDYFRDKLTGQYTYIVKYLNIWHVPGDKYAPQMTLDLGILKDADALDRVRYIGPDPRFLRTKYTRSLVPLAKALYYLSEDKHRAGLPLFDCVLAAAVELGLITDD